MKPVFLDTVGLIAVWDEADQWHAAVTVFVQVLGVGRQLLTTTLILYEGGNAASRRPYRTDVDDLRQRLAADGRLIEPTTLHLETAWAAYRAGHAGVAGIVDHVSFAVMRRLGLTEAFLQQSCIVRRQRVEGSTRRGRVRRAGSGTGVDATATAVDAAAPVVSTVVDAATGADSSAGGSAAPAAASSVGRDTCRRGCQSARGNYPDPGRVSRLRCRW